MRTITHFLARKGGASTSTAFAVPTPAKPGSPAAEEPSEPTLADIGARVGEENEALRNLLIDTDRRIGALDDLKDAFRNLVEPIGSALQALEQEKSDNVGLRNALAELRAGHESVRTEFSALEKRAAELESAGEELSRELALAQQAVRGLEGDKAELTSEIVAARAEVANLESQLAQETANGRALSEANQILVDHSTSADKRIVELQSEGALMREKLLLLENDKRSLQTALDQTLAEASRLSRRLTESENALTAARARLEQMDISLAATENERVTLATARDEANERHQSEAYAMNLRLEALRSRAATAEKLLAEVRQTLAARTEDIRVLERKAVEANIARNATEKVVERLTTARDGLDGKVRELEQGRASLTERSNILAETLKARETSLAHAEQKIKSLTDRIAEIEVDAGAYRAKTERRIDELNASLQRERVELAVAQGALETTRRDYARLQRDMLGGERRSVAPPSRRSPTPPKNRRNRETAEAAAAVRRRWKRSRKATQRSPRPRDSLVHGEVAERAADGPREAQRASYGCRSTVIHQCSGCQGGGALPADLDGCIDIEHSREWRTAWLAAAATQHRNSGCNTAGCAAGSNKSTRWGSCGRSMVPIGMSRWVPSPTCSRKRAAAARRRSCSTTFPAIPAASARSTGSCPPCAALL